MTPEQIAEMTGQTNFQKGNRMVLNEVLLNGDPEVGAYRKRIWVDKADGKPAEEDLGKSLNVVFLKIRRKLVERGRDGSIARATNEHDTVNDTVTVYEGGTEVFTGPAKAAREKYEALRTVQIVYSLLLHVTKEPELVRISIKGASLGSEAKAKDVMDFYQYISMFDSEPVTSRVTKLGVVKEEGRKAYYAMTFEQGAPVEKMKDVVLEKLQYVHNHTKAKAPQVDEPVIVIPEEHPLEAAFTKDEEIDVSEIPF